MQPRLQLALQVQRAAVARFWGILSEFCALGGAPEQWQHSALGGPSSLSATSRSSSGRSFAWWTPPSSAWRVLSYAYGKGPAAVAGVRCGGPFVSFQQPAAAGGGRSIGRRRLAAGVGSGFCCRLWFRFVVYFSFSGHWPYGLITCAFVVRAPAGPRAPDMHLCGSLRLQGLAPPLGVVLGQPHPTHCFKGPHTLAAQAGCRRVLARPAACLAAPAALAVRDVLPPRRAPLPVTPLLAIAHGQCSAYCPFSIQRFSLDPDPWPLGWTAPQHYRHLPPSLAFPAL